MKIKMKKVFAGTLAFLMSVSYMAYPTYAKAMSEGRQSENEIKNMSAGYSLYKADMDTKAVENNAGAFHVTGGTNGNEWTYDNENNTLTFNKSGIYTVMGDGAETTERIILTDNFTGTVTIENINIQGTGEIISLGQNTHLTLKFNGENNICTTDESTAAISTTYESSSLTFDSDTNGVLNVSASNSGVAIGSMSNTYNITFNGGTINARGSSYQKTDIGVSLYGDGSSIVRTGIAKNIVINGGTVNCLTSALGSSYSGNRFYSIQCEVIINGGTITAHYIGGSTADDWGTPITSVVINGGSVKGEIQTYTPLSNSKGDEISRVIIPINEEVSNVKVDGTDYVINSNHSDDNNLYIYTTRQNHTITINEIDYTIYWSDNTFKIKNIEPTVIVTERTASTITVQKLDNQDTYGIAEYSLDGTDWQESNIFSGLSTDTIYTVYARYKGNDTYTQSKVGSISVKTMKDGNMLIEEPSHSEGKYKQKLSDIELLNGWKWEKGDTLLTNLGEASYPAIFDTTSYETEYDFTNVEGYDKEKHQIKRNLSIYTSKANSTVLITTENMDKVYDGNEIAAPNVKISGTTSEVSFKWFQKITKQDWILLEEAPTDVGSYIVIAEVEEDEYYKAAFDERQFVISQAENMWIDTLSITSWTYGEEANAPTATAKFGDVTFTYSDKKDGSYTTNVPSNAGTYYVKATVTGTTNYTGLEANKEFTIAKAVPAYTISTDLTLTQGKALSELALPSGFTWKDAALTADELGNHSFKAIFTPMDTNNYESVEVDITVHVVPVLTPINNVPIISAEDIVLTVGDSFDVKTKATAQDKEDGDLTDALIIIENTVDTTKAGTYVVTYSVMDSDGAATTKTIVVTVKEKAIAVEPSEPAEPDNKPIDTDKPVAMDKPVDTDKSSVSDKVEVSVPTGETSHIMLWGMCGMLAMAVMMMVNARRKYSK